MNMPLLQKPLVRTAFIVIMVVAIVAAWLLFRSKMPATMPEGFAIEYMHTAGMLDRSESYRLQVGESEAVLRYDGTERSYLFDVSEDEMEMLYRRLRSERFLNVAQVERGMIFDAEETTVTLSFGTRKETVRDGALTQVAVFSQSRFDAGVEAIAEFVGEKIANDSP